MEISLGFDKNWDKFTERHLGGSILQSSIWGDFQKSLGNEVFFFALKEKKEIKGGTLLSSIPLPFSCTYFYLPKGPLLDFKKKKDTELLLERISKLASEKKAVFLRIEPNFPDPEGLFSLKLKKLGFIRPKVLVNQRSPQTTLILDLQRPSEEILLQMKQKTRYNIRLGQRKGVKVYQTTKPSDIEIFWRLAQETMVRDKIRFFPKEYYYKLLKVLNKKGKGSLFIATFKEKPLSSLIVSFFGPFATYMHGATASAFRNLMASYLCQWEAIGEAKKRNCLFYDFWGVSPLKVKKEKVDERELGWAGISRFKRGFGGEEINYPGSFDLVYNKNWYEIFALGGKLRRWLK